MRFDAPASLPAIPSKRRGDALLLSPDYGGEKSVELVNGLLERRGVLRDRGCLARQIASWLRLDHDAARGRTGQLSAVKVQILERELKMMRKGREKVS